jgi:hypothetical protein
MSDKAMSKPARYALAGRITVTLTEVYRDFPQLKGKCQGQIKKVGARHARPLSPRARWFHQSVHFEYITSFATLDSIPRQSSNQSSPPFRKST